MKLLPLRQSAVFVSALLATAGRAAAHPGHAAFDWTVAPHAGHESESALLLMVVALTAAGYIGRWVVSRKR